MAGRGKLSDWSADDLERAAKFMRELDASANARSAFELAKREQDVEIAKSKASEKEAEANKAAQMGQLERIRGEETRKLQQVKVENEKMLMQYKVEAERENLKVADQLQRRRDEDNRRAALEDERLKAAVRRQAEEEIQAERRRTEEHRAKLERENMKSRALAEAEGRIKEQRDNEDVFTRQLRLKATEDRLTRLEAINATFKNLGDYLGSFVLDTQRVTATVTALTALAAGVYLTREGAKVGAAVVQKRLLTPALVRETSRSTGHFGIAHRFSRLLGREQSKEGYSLSDVVLGGDLEKRVPEIATSVTNTKAHGAPYRHMLFYGPPGTGKTMVAKRLARSSGLDYAIMSGGDVGPLGRDGVTQLHKLFDWAETSKRGVLLFIDEADAFLASRSKTSMSEDQRNALNALLFRTGEASKKLMLVLATNRPGDLDAAVVDRVDESLHFGLPTAAGRRALVKQYFEKYITRAGEEAQGGLLGGAKKAAAITVAGDVDAAYLNAVADKLEGFSGRAISKLLLGVQGTVYGRAGKEGTPTLTRAVMDEVVSWKLEEAGAKAAFGSAAFDFVSESKSGNSGRRAANIAAPEMK